MTNVLHALGLHMHQPLSNIELLLDSNEWEARQILHCYQRPLTYLQQYADVARVHLGFSGTLLEQFLDSTIQQRCAGIQDIGRMLGEYWHTPNVEFIGMGYYHPVFPLIPMEDWAEHLWRHQAILKSVFGQEAKGFFPPEMGFAMEMIPPLVETGYEYVLVDAVHVLTEDGNPGSPYRPYLAEYDGQTTVIIPRDRDISNAQESGMDAGWFTNEALAKTGSAPRPALVTSWSDGENGGWFRNMHDPSNFWGHFFSPFMEQVQAGGPIRPVLLSEFIEEHPPQEKVTVRTGAWNVGSTSGYDFSQWAGSEKQKAALDDIFELSRDYWELRRAVGEDVLPAVEQKLEQARALVLQAQSSDYLFWGDAWIPKVYEVIARARETLKQIQ